MAFKVNEKELISVKVNNKTCNVVKVGDVIVFQSDLRPNLLLENGGFILLEDGNRIDQ